MQHAGEAVARHTLDRLERQPEQLSVDAARLHEAPELHVRLDLVYRRKAVFTTLRLARPRRARRLR